MPRCLSRLKLDTRAVTAIEYGLLAALISLAIVAGVTTTGGRLSTVFSHIGSDL